MSVTVAISDACRRPNDYAPAFALAREAIELMVRLGRRGTIVAAGDLGTYGLLLRASSREELDAFAQRTLRPVIDHDRAHGGDLLTTLRAYIAEDRVQRRVAARCFIHVNTVVYRIRRIEALLGVHLDDPATVFDVTLASATARSSRRPASATAQQPGPSRVRAGGAFLAHQPTGRPCRAHAMPASARNPAADRSRR